MNDATLGTRLAAIDVGSNAIRYMAAEARRDGPRVLHQLRVPIRLGHDVFRIGSFTNETIADVLNALGVFANVNAHLGVTHVRAVATSAMRESANGPALVELAARRNGVDIEVIDGDEEARLVYVAVSSRVDFGGRHWLLVDLGGGSLEVSIVSDSGITATRSLPIGAVRLLEAHGERASAATFEAHVAQFRKELESTPAIASQPHGMIATGGNIEAIVRVLGIRNEKNGVARLDAVLLRKCIEILDATPVTERQARWNLNPGRGDVILPAAIVYSLVAQCARVDEILSPNVGVKEGIILDLIARLKS